MRYCLAVSLCLVATSVQAEPFSVWEQDGAIWSRDEAIPGSDWQISQRTNCHSPMMDGPVAVWITSGISSSDVWGRDVTQTNYHASWIVQIGPASDPLVSYLGLPDEWAYAAWREGGGIWGRELRGGPGSPTLELVPDYTGPYELDGRMLIWDGGTLEMDFPIPEIPEPGTLVLLAFAALCIAGHVNNRRGISK